MMTLNQNILGQEEQRKYWILYVFSYEPFYLTIDSFVVVIFFYILSTISLLPIFGGRVSFFVSLVKFFPSFSYFFLFFDGAFVAYDDVGYLTKSAIILEKHGVDVFTLMFNAEGVQSLASIVQSQHVTYYWILAILQFFFGGSYYVPVLFNVFLTSLATLIFYKILFFHNFSRTFSLFFALYFTLHATLISWASFMAVRDVFILTLSLLFYWSIVNVFARFSFLNLLAVLIISYFFVLSRFYTPVVMSLCFIMAFMVTKYDQNIRISSKLKIFTFCIMSVLLFLFFTSNYAGATRFLDIGIGSIYGAMRFFLTPIPFNLSESYYFLIVDAYQHWLFLPFFICGVIYSFARNEFSLLRNFLFFNIFVFCLIFGSFEDQQGVRYRVQISYCIIFFQYIGLFFLFSKFHPKEVKWFQK